MHLSDHFCIPGSAPLNRDVCYPPAGPGVHALARRLRQLRVMDPAAAGGMAVATVLIVDDEQPIVDLVRFTLEDEQVQVVEARDGVQALEAARTHLPDLIFLDVRMPRLGGFEVCRRLRQEPGLGKSKIVMLTAASQEADRAQGQAAGADEYLTKPFSPLKLLTLVQALLPGVPLWPAR